MISDQDRQVIRECARRYGVKSVLLFGSSLRDPSARDIDLAVDGVRPELFFAFYGDLLFQLSMPVDLVDLSADTKFTRIVRREGISLYG